MYKLKSVRSSWCKAILPKWDIGPQKSWQVGYQKSVGAWPNCGNFLAGYVSTLNANENHGLNLAENSIWQKWKRSTGADVMSILKEKGEVKPGVSRHSVLIVGFGVYEGENFFLIKNSWGSEYGDSGYYKIGTTANTDSGLQVANEIFRLVVWLIHLLNKFLEQLSKYD